MWRPTKSRGDEMLGIYLNDQLAMAITWRELAYRAAQNNHGTSAQLDLKIVAEAIADDVRQFRDIMRRLSIKQSRVKKLVAVAAERGGRLKLNGRLTTFSPLSRFIELETLAMAIEAKKHVWETLADLAALDERLPDIEFDRLIHRAESQRKAIQPLRQSAAAQAFLTQRRTTISG